MDANLAGQKAVGVVAVHGKRRGLQPGLLTRLVVVENSLKSLPLRPAQIHSQQHVSPVLRLRASGSGMNRHNGVAGVVFAGQKRFRL